MTVLSDAFTRADNADLGASWTPMTGVNSLKIVSNNVQAGTLLTADCTERYSATAVGNDQESRVVIGAWTKTTNNIYIWAAARQASGAYTEYEFIASTDATNISYIVQNIAGSKTTLALVTSGSWSVGNVLDGIVKGTALRLYQNSNLIVSTTDGGIASGNVGMGMYSPDAFSAVQIDSWQGGDSIRMPAKTAQFKRRLAA